MEMVVVIAIIGVVSVFALDIGRSALRGSERMETQKRLGVIQKALDFYAEKNGYLPCPANPALLPSDANFGFESRSGTAGAGCVVTGGITLANNVYTGMLPFRNLGLSDLYAGDAWNNKILYAVSNQHMGTSFNNYYANTGTIQIRQGTRAGTNYLITTRQDGNAGAAASYVALSHGRNGAGAYPVNSTTIATACPVDTSIEVENCNRDDLFFVSDYNEGNIVTTRFDDMLVWGSNAMVRNPTATLTNGCPANVCEPWCAPCATFGTSTPPGAATRICTKIITSNQPSCQALCIWPSSTSPCP